jgi:hypothetical protein
MYREESAHVPKKTVPQQGFFADDLVHLFYEHSEYLSHVFLQLM